MANFLLIYRGGDTEEAGLSPEQMQKYMQQWGDWIGQGFQSGFMVSAGDELKKEGRVVHPDKVVSDGPFAESKELVGGYSIIQAADLEAAAEIAKGCPLLTMDGTVEIRELAGIAPSPEDYQ